MQSDAMPANQKSTVKQFYFASSLISLISLHLGDPIRRSKCSSIVIYNGIGRCRGIQISDIKLP